MIPNCVPLSPDCQPCSEKELLHTYCSADFVAVGHLAGVDHVTFQRHNEEAVNHLTPSPLAISPSAISPHKPGAAYLKFLASKVLRTPDETADVRLFDPARSRGAPTRISIPQHCGMQAGAGEYILMGRMKLGSPTLQCVPQLDQFRQIAKKRADQAPCYIHL